MFFFRARAEKGIAWHIEASNVVWTLVDNGKLANQIACEISGSCGKNGIFRWKAVTPLLYREFLGVGQRGNVEMAKKITSSP